MTAAQLRSLDASDLSAAFDALRATRLPSGTFDGVAWPVPAWPLWRGKVFTGSAVVNRLGRGTGVPGLVSLVGDDVVIHYPQLGLRDSLRPVSDTLWLGYLETRVLRRPFIWFTLEQSQ